MTDETCQACGGSLVDGECPKCMGLIEKATVDSNGKSNPDQEGKHDPESSSDRTGDADDKSKVPDAAEMESQIDTEPDPKTRAEKPDEKESGDGDSKSPKDNPTDDESIDTEDYSTAIEQDDLDLLKELKDKIMGAQSALEDDVMEDFDSLSRRFDGVMESIDRIEQIDSPSSTGDIVITAETAPSGETTPQLEEDVPAVTEETVEEADKTDEKKRDSPLKAILSMITDGPLVDDKAQFSLTSDSPYTDVELDAETMDSPEVEGSYIVDEQELIMNLLKLAMFKKERGNMKEVTEILQMAYQLNPHDEKLQSEIKRIHPVLEIPRDLEKIPESGGDIPIKEEVEAAKVLVPELEDEITSLQKKASSTLKHAEKLMRTSSIPQDKFDDFSNSIMEARELFDEKRFHKSNEISISIITHLKGMIQENIDTQTQANIDKARSMVEEISGGSKDLPKETVDKIREDFDRAVKSYLVDEFERANLLAKRVIAKILEFSEPEGIEIREGIAAMRKEIRSVKEIPLFARSTEDLESVLVKAENLLDKREIASSTMLMSRAQEALDEIMTRKQLYATAQELQIRLNNRVDRLIQAGYGIADIKRKIDYLNEYFEQERFEDVITIGGDIDSSLEGLELSRWEKEAKETFTQLEEMVEYSKEMEEISEFREKFDAIKARYEGGDVTVMRSEGKELLDTLRKSVKAISLTRTKRIASGIVDARMNISKLRALNIETIDFERRVRKAKNLIKEENYLEGIRQLDRVNKEMSGKINKDLTYLRNFSDVHRDALEAILDRYRDEPVIYMIRKKRIPLIRKMIELGRYRKALDLYNDVESHFSSIKARDDVKTRVESYMTECKFELYKRKDLGQDISEPLALYTQATKKLNKNSVVQAEFLTEVSRRYCDQFLPAI
ncbi:MAG: hypothetical protein ACMUIG_07075 [Thermoplasmatota archaeon]